MYTWQIIYGENNECWDSLAALSENTEGKTILWSMTSILRYDRTRSKVVVLSETPSMKG
jgi:hypothetical protein